MSTEKSETMAVLSDAPPKRLQDAQLLVVDDSRTMRLALARALNGIGFQNITEATDGKKALELLGEKSFDVMLLDIEMPEMNGMEVLTAVKANPEWRDLPVIVISGSEQIDSAVKCIELGAEDYLPKPFNPTLLRARVNTSVEKKQLRDLDRLRVVQLQREKDLLQQTQNRLQEELDEATRYVASILPPPTDGDLRIQWTYLPSTEMGGDSFGYHWLDENHFAIYLLDVCGHGIAAALLSVAAINVIRSGALPGTNFLDPGKVLAGLNEAFQMERHNNSYFTLWYGVYNKNSHELCYASGGHPPPLLLKPAGSGFEVEELGAPGMIIGGIPGSEYEMKTTIVPGGSRLFVYCDGAFEIRQADGTMLDYDKSFVPRILNAAQSPKATEEMLTWAREQGTKPILDDDFSMIAIDFPKS